MSLVFFPELPLVIVGRGAFAGNSPGLGPESTWSGPLTLGPTAQSSENALGALRRARYPRRSFPPSSLCALLSFCWCLSSSCVSCVLWWMPFNSLLMYSYEDLAPSLLCHVAPTPLLRFEVCLCRSVAANPTTSQPYPFASTLGLTEHATCQPLDIPEPHPWFPFALTFVRQLSLLLVRDFPFAYGPLKRQAQLRVSFASSQCPLPVL